MPISIILDIVISVLLVLTIAYAVRLNQRLSQLRADKHELQHLADIFVEATRRAEAGIAQLKISSDGLSADITQAETLKDDLDYLVERGERVANALMEETRMSPTAPYGPSESLRKTRAVEKKPPRSARPRAFDREARLIEDAIRAATPPSLDENEARPGAHDDTERLSGGIPDMGAPRAGVSRALSAGTQAPRTQAPRAQVPGTQVPGTQVSDDDDGIGDSQAARELLKALGTVK